MKSQISNLKSQIYILNRKSFFSLFTFHFSLFFVIFSLFTFHFSPASALADVTCQPIYGGGQTCVQSGNVQVVKTVIGSQTGAPGQSVSFKIDVTNTGSAAIPTITVQDVFPQFINFVSSSIPANSGRFDRNIKTLTFTISNLKAGETRSSTVTGKIVAANLLPSNQGTVCVVNQAIAQAEGQVSQSNAQFCITMAVATPAPVTKGGLKVFPPPSPITTPSTGPEMIPLLALIPGGLMGILLRKKTRTNKELSA